MLHALGCDFLQFSPGGSGPAILRTPSRWPVNTTQGVTFYNVQPQKTSLLNISLRKIFAASVLKAMTWSAF